MNLRRFIDGDEVDVHAFGADSSVTQRPDDIIITASQVDL
jgi:hypothetical protein